MGTERRIGNPDYVGVWFDKTHYAPELGLKPTVGPFIICLEDVLPPLCGIMLDPLGLARLVGGEFANQVRFTKTYVTDERGRKTRGSRLEFHYAGETDSKGLTAGKWRTTVCGRDLSGEFLMQQYTEFLKDRGRVRSRIVSAWLDAQIEALQKRHLAGIETRLIDSAKKEVVLIE